MNADTGALYHLRPELFEGQAPLTTQAFVNIPPEELTADERAAELAVRSGDPVVPVSPRVVQQMELGRRELERRARRREQQRKGRGR